MKAKSFNVPNKLRFMVGANAIFRHLRLLIGDAFVGDADGRQHGTHRVRKDRLEPLRFANWDDDRKPRAFADEKQVLATADPEDVAVPVAEPSRRYHVGLNFGPFQPHEQLACAPQNDHRIDRVIHIRMRGTTCAQIERRSAAPFRGDTRGTYRQ